MSETIYITGPSPLLIVNKAIQIGSNAPFLGSFSGKYSPTSGWSFNQKFSGLSYWQMQRLAYLYSSSGCSYTISYENGKVTLETEDNRGNVTIDTWEIGVNRTTRGSFQNPLDIAALSANDLKVIAYGFQNGIPNLPDVLDALNKSQTGGPVYSLPDITTPSATQRFYDRVMTLGQESYQFDQYSLRHMTNASNRGFYNVADENVNYIYTYANFISEITNTNYWIFPAPPEILGALSVIFGNLSSPQSDYMQGALKGGSGRVTAANNRVNITTEYQIDVWSTDEYSSF